MPLNIYILAQTLKSYNSSYSHSHDAGTDTHTQTQSCTNTRCFSLSSGQLIQGYLDSEESMRARTPFALEPGAAGAKSNKNFSAAALNELFFVVLCFLSFSWRRRNETHGAMWNMWSN